MDEKEVTVRRLGRAGVALAVVLGLGADAPGDPRGGPTPIYRAGLPQPTKDKPQSKLWQAHGRWWAWLPVPDGSVILERTPGGWRELEHLRPAFKGLPGQADVWAGSDAVRAALVGDDRLAVVELRYDPGRRTYVPGRLRHEFAMEGVVAPPARLETATIARDATGRWWVAFDRGRDIRVAWTTDRDGLDWSRPLTIGTGVRPDDIAAIFALGDRVGVLWSDQAADAVVFREHLDARPPDRWETPIDVDRGGKTADDHINGVLADDGTLYVATKNSVDTVGRPQLVLRIRRPDGRWSNVPYAERREGLEPSRPIVLLGGEPPRLILLHTVYDRRPGRPRGATIVRMTADPNRLDLSGAATPLLAVDAPVNDATGPKARLTGRENGLILASDAEGRVYEATIPGPSSPE